MLFAAEMRKSDHRPTNRASHLTKSLTQSIAPLTDGYRKGCWRSLASQSVGTLTYKTRPQGTESSRFLYYRLDLRHPSRLASSSVA
jgi:hypothetical protein